jgi:uncharacterized protein with HEPN domain
MARRRAPLALYHIRDTIADFLNIVGTASVQEIAADKSRRYAAERCIEIISEASRRIPARWKHEHPDIPWQQIAGIGNIMRHDYEDVNLEIILGLRGKRLVDLHAAVTALLQKHDPSGQPFFDRE